MQKEVARELLLIAKELVAAEGDKCGPKGCIRKVGDGWKIMSGKTGKFWKQTPNLTKLSALTTNS